MKNNSVVSFKPQATDCKFHIVWMRLLFVSFLILVAWSLEPAACKIFAQDKIIAIVNKDIITQKDLDDFIQFSRMQLASEYTKDEVESKIKEMTPELLDKLIEDRIILQEAKKNNVKMDESRVKARIQELKERYGSDAEFQDALRRQGVVQADIETRIREQFLMYSIIEAKVRSKILINPNEVTSFYEENSAEFRLPEQLQLDSLNTNDAQKAKEIFVSLKGGKDPQELKEDESVAIDKMTVVKGQLRKEIEDVVFKLQPQEVSEPLKIGDRFYIFKLNSIIPARQQNLSEIRDKVYGFLSEKKMKEALAAWLNELKKYSYIKIFQN